MDIQKPIQIKPHIFGLDRFGFFKNNHPNRTELHVIFILDRMIFCLKTDPNWTANTPSYKAKGMEIGGYGENQRLCVITVRNGRSHCVLRDCP